MKYIDADKLVAGIKHLQEKFPVATYEALYHLITSLQQVQPEEEFEDKFAKFLERKDAELGANSWNEEDLRELAEYFYFNNKQPEVDLEKAYKSYMESRKDDLSGNAVTVNMKDLARHFYELGLNARKEE